MVEREYENLKFQQPYQQAMYYCSLILGEQMWSWTDQLNVLPYLNVEDLEKFKRRMLSKTFLECYFGGSQAFFLTKILFDQYCNVIKCNMLLNVLEVVSQEILLQMKLDH